MQNSQAQAPGAALHHLRRTLSHTLTDILLFGLIGAVVGGGSAEVVGWVLTGSVPNAPTHVAAVVVAVLLAYAMALTVAFRALLKGITQSAEWVVGEVERVVGGVVHEADTVLHIPEDIAHMSQPSPARDGARQPVGMIAGIPEES
ncbi:MAG TPA: hypothetical protein VF808_11830 [Ktedonobacterales bacterium]